MIQKHSLRQSKKITSLFIRYSLFFTGLVYILFFFFRLPRGFDLTDSGYYLCLYRNFHTSPKAHSYYLSNWLGYIILENSNYAVIAIRIFSFFLFCISVFFSWKSFAQLKGQQIKLAKCIMTIFALFFIARFPFENIFHFSTTLSASIILFLLNLSFNNPNKNIWFFLSGIMLIISALLRIVNIVFLVPGIITIFFIPKNHKNKFILFYALGITVGSFITWLSLSIVNQWDDFYQMIMRIFFVTSKTSTSHNLVKLLLRYSKDIMVILVLLLLIFCYRMLIRIIRKPFFTNIFFFISLIIAIGIAYLSFTHMGFILIFYLGIVALLIDQVLIPLIYTIVKNYYLTIGRDISAFKLFKILRLEKNYRFSLDIINNWDKSVQATLLIAFSLFFSIMFGTSISINMSKTLWILLLPIPVFFLKSHSKKNNATIHSPGNQWKLLATCTMLILSLYLAAVSVLYPYLDTNLFSLSTEINHPYLKHIKTSPYKAEVIAEFIDLFDRSIDSTIVDTKVLTFGSLPMIDYLIHQSSMTNQYWIDLDGYSTKEFIDDISKYEGRFVLIIEKFVPYDRNWPKASLDDYDPQSITAEKWEYIKSQIILRDMELSFETDMFFVYH